MRPLFGDRQTHLSYTPLCYHSKVAFDRIRPKKVRQLKSQTFQANFVDLVKDQNWDGKVKRSICKALHRMVYRARRAKPEERGVVTATPQMDFLRSHQFSFLTAPAFKGIFGVIVFVSGPVEPTV